MQYCKTAVWFCLLHMVERSVVRRLFGNAAVLVHIDQCAAGTGLADNLAVLAVKIDRQVGYGTANSLEPDRTVPHAGGYLHYCGLGNPVGLYMVGVRTDIHFHFRVKIEEIADIGAIEEQYSSVPGCMCRSPNSQARWTT